MPDRPQTEPGGCSFQDTEGGQQHDGLYPLRGRLAEKEQTNKNKKQEKNPCRQTGNQPMKPWIQPGSMGGGERVLWNLKMRQHPAFPDACRQRFLWLSWQQLGLEHSVQPEFYYTVVCSSLTVRQDALALKTKRMGTYKNSY
mmetsp:Transcript_8963/g.20532  ORF Transcript_8963/g.20532 Transcript_8963/m.20532 type:complete len:142 (-) Transcript_8963:1533-1958(-)